MAQIPLKLDPNSSSNQGGAAQPEKTPVMGYAAVGFGLLGIFTVGFIFTPLGLICSVLALFMGQAVWGFIGLLLAIAGILSSAVLMGIIGFGAAFAFFDFDGLVKPILDIINSIIGDGGTREV